MMSRTKFYPHWEANDILRAVKFDMLEKNGSSYNFKEANWRRPISELLRKKILLKSRSGNRYDLVIARAENALGTGKFE